MPVLMGARIADRGRPRDRSILGTAARVGSGVCVSRVRHHLKHKDLHRL
ncbi:hypothetical protein MNBD_ACTINO02-1808 [hydrothermal vent metagenome]|uniref:Uncharacterized protein n=1 Tax=hydrothermal vent metagenome TaxID=652676 RepID=A0A3B0T653_9ZZZZ